MIRLSIIIPVYNVEQYLAKCLDSVLQQDIPLEEYEVIVVNDGSPDGSMAIAEDYAIRYSNVKVISRPNGGLSAARNTGFENAKGEYIWFVDSDDWISFNTICTLLRLVYKDSLDILCFGVNYYHNDNHIDKSAHPSENYYIVDGIQYLCFPNVIPTAWSAIYRRRFILENNLSFYEGILHEDQEFTPRAYSLAKRIAYYPQHVYFYNQRIGSIMKSNRSIKRCKDLLTVADSLYMFMQKYIKCDSMAYPVFQDKINFAFTQSLAFYSKEAFGLSEYKKREYYPLKNNNGLSTKYRLANFSLNLYILINRIVNH